MTSPVRNIVRSASSQKSLNILMFICDGYFETMLCEAFPQHQFYGPINDHNPPSGWNFNLCPQPDNFHYIPNFHQSNIISKIDFDLIICHDRTSQYDIAQQLAHALHINVIIVEHIVNTETLDLIAMIPLLKKTKNDTNIFIGDIQNQFSILGPTIHYGIPNIHQSDKKNQIIILDTDQQTIDSLTPHISVPIKIYNINELNVEQYHALFQESQFFFNLSAEITRLQLPVLYAMSAGCVVISITSPVITDLITHMETGIIINNVEELLNIFNNIDTVDLKRIGQNANQYIADNYSLEEFRNKWHETLNTTAWKTYIVR